MHSHTESPSAATAAAEEALADFVSFEETFLCPGCERPLPLLVQPVHLSMEIRCPRCGRQLTNMIRRAIRRQAMSS